MSLKTKKIKSNVSDTFQPYCYLKYLALDRLTFGVGFFGFGDILNTLDFYTSLAKF